MNKKKIIFFSNTFSPYQRDFLEEVSKKNHIKAIFNDKNTFNSPWNIKKNNHIKDISSYDYVNRKNYYKKLLKNFNPNVILIGGYNIRDIFTISFLAKKIATNRSIPLVLQKKNKINLLALVNMFYS